MSSELGTLLCTIFLLPIAIWVVPIIHYGILKVYRGRQASKGQEGKPEELENQSEISESDTEDVFKQDISFWRIFSMHSTAWVYLWIIYFAASAGSQDFEDDYPGTRTVANIFGYVHVPLFVIFLYIETFFSWEWKYLSNIIEEKSCRVYIRELTEATPTVTATAVAWHFETRTRTVAYMVNGNTHYRTETYQEKVIDYTESRNFHFARWEDISPSPDTLSLDPNKLTRIIMLKTVLFGDEETESLFKQVMTELEASVRKVYPSSYVDSAKEDEIPGFESRLLAYWEIKEPKWWIKKRVYVLASFLLMVWVYRIVFSLTTQKACFKIVKKIYV